MSLIKKADVMNHLSMRHRTEIHLIRPESQPDATCFAQEESPVADSKVNDLPESPLSIPTTSAPEAALVIVCKSGRA